MLIEEEANKTRALLFQGSNFKMYEFGEKNK